MIEIGIFSDLYRVGITEDGTEAISECYYVMAEAPDGRRWNHVVPFHGSKAVFDEEIGANYYPDLRDEAREKAQTLADRVTAHLKAGGQLNPAHWVEDRPRYGSTAYQELDSTGYFRDLEKQEDQGR